MNPSNRLSDEDEYNSADSDLEQLVSPRRPAQSPSVSPRRLLQPDPPQVEEVLEVAGNRLSDLPERRRRQEAAAAAAAAVAAANMPVVDFEDENGADDDRALQEGCRNVEKVAWDDSDLNFFFNQVEIKMAAVGVKKQYTKLQCLSNALPNKVISEVKVIAKYIKCWN